MSAQRRRLAFAIALAAHLLLLWAILRTPVAEPPISPGSPTMQLALVGPSDAPPRRPAAAQAPPTAPTPASAEPTPPTPAAPSPLGTSPPAPAASPALPPAPPPVDATAEPESLHPAAPTSASLAAPATGGPDCGLTRLLTLGLRGDPAVRAALPAIPPDVTPRGAGLALWNQGWVEVPDGMGGRSTLPIRRAIVEIVRAAPPACRGEIVHGPVFIPLPDPSRPTVVVLGSSVWRWTDLTVGEP